MYAPPTPSTPNAPNVTGVLWIQTASVQQASESFKVPTATRLIAAELPRYFHSDDYSMLVGAVQYDVQTKMWRLQYSEADKTDPLGGTVSLVGLDPEETALRSGMIVAVRGTFANPNSQDAIRVYRLQEIRIISE